MNIKFKNAVGKSISNLVSVAYFKNGEWRLYDHFAGYRVRTKKKANNLIEEVAGEMHVRKENVKLVEVTSLITKRRNFNV